MFQLLDIIIALGIVYLILSMVHKYLMSMIKRAGMTKAKIIDREIRAFSRAADRINFYDNREIN